MSLLEAAFATVKAALEETAEEPARTDSSLGTTTTTTTTLGAGGGPRPHDDAVVRLARLEAARGGGATATGRAAYGAVERAYTARVAESQRVRVRVEMRRALRLGRLAILERAVGAKVDGALAHAACTAAETDARLRRQVVASDRRLQELAHECVGEYEKARRRIFRRRDHAADRVEADRHEVRLNARWAIFAARCNVDDGFGRPNKGAKLDLRDVQASSSSGRFVDDPTHHRAPAATEKKTAQQPPPPPSAAALPPRDFGAYAAAAKEALTRPGPTRTAALAMLRTDARTYDDHFLRLALQGAAITRCIAVRGAALFSARAAVSQQSHEFFPHTNSTKALADLLRGPTKSNTSTPALTKTLSSSSSVRSKQQQQQQQQPQTRHLLKKPPMPCSLATPVPNAPVAWLVVAAPSRGLEKLEFVAAVGTDEDDWAASIRKAEAEPDPATAQVATAFVYYRVAERAEAAVRRAEEGVDDRVSTPGSASSTAPQGKKHVFEDRDLAEAHAVATGAERRAAVDGRRGVARAPSCLRCRRITTRLLLPPTTEPPPPNDGPDFDQTPADDDSSENEGGAPSTFPFLTPEKVVDDDDAMYTLAGGPRGDSPPMVHTESGEVFAAATVLQLAETAYFAQALAGRGVRKAFEAAAAKKDAGSLGGGGGGGGGGEEAQAPLWSALDSLWVPIAIRRPLANGGAPEPAWAMRRLADCAVAELVSLFVFPPSGGFQGDFENKNNAPAQAETTSALALGARDVVPREGDHREYYSLLAPKLLALPPPATTGDPQTGDAPERNTANEGLFVAWRVPMMMMMMTPTPTSTTGAVDEKMLPEAAKVSNARASPRVSPRRRPDPGGASQVSTSRADPPYPPPDHLLAEAAATDVVPLHNDDDDKDDDILGEFCQWRACVRKACPPRKQHRAGFGPQRRKKKAQRRLCAWHAELKSFLDAQASADKPSESARFVPKQQRQVEGVDSSASLATMGTDDLAAAIKRASPLLVELANGKLGATVRVFCRRAAAEASLRAATKDDASHNGHHPNDRPWTATGASQLVASPNGRPSWARWRDARGATAHRAAIQTSIQSAEYISAAERAVTRELAALQEARIFPRRALEAIRREHQRLEREREEAQLLQPPVGIITTTPTTTTTDAAAAAAAQRHAQRATDERLELEFARRKLALLREFRRSSSTDGGKKNEASSLDRAASSASLHDHLPNQHPQGAADGPFQQSPDELPSPAASHGNSSQGSSRRLATGQPTKSTSERKRFVSPYATKSDIVPRRAYR